MRISTRNQIIEILPTILYGINYAKGADRQQAKAMLYDCHDAVSAVSDTLEAGLSAERYLDYTGILSELKGAVESLIESASEGKLYSSLAKSVKNQLSQLKNKLLNEPEVKLEILFLPYNATMWDSLESIWKAAKDDPRCECYVVPIPYYQRNSDLSLGKLCYDGFKFPKDVPVVSFESYDISARRPDIVYIHNPYDEMNYVISVDPRYYSYELKKHARMLVYVPYYVTDGTIPEILCKVPAIYHADKTIVQSEQIRKQHLKINPASDIAALGSPKIDRVLYFEENRPKLPESWEEAIGSKKVVLYNTSLHSLLNCNDKYIRRLRYVFSCFEKRDDVLLLWRPHPLSSSTVSSMRPDFLKSYCQIESEFKEKGIGILDDSPDVERAIAVSDAYLGDKTSSLVHMYGVTGKPVMLQDITIGREPNEEELQSVWFGSAEFEGDFAWFPCGSYNGLCKVNLNTGQAEFIAHIPNEDRDGVHLYNDILKLENNKLLLPPLLGREIAVYDRESHSFEKIPVKGLGGATSAKFFKATPYKGYAFITPHIYPAIIRYDIKTGECKYYTEWYDKLKPHIANHSKPIFANGVCVRDNLLLMAFAQDNLIMEFNMDTGKTKFHTVGRKGNNYWNMAFDGSDYWLIQNNNKGNESIVRWNYETGATTEYSDFPNGFGNGQSSFNEIVFCKNYLLAFPRFANMIVKIDAKTGEMSEFKTGLEYKEGERKSEYYNLRCNYYFARPDGKGNVIAISMYDYSLLKINVETEKAVKLKIALKKDDIGSYISFGKGCKKSAADCHYSESKYLTLDRLLDYITSDKYKKDPLQAEAYSKIFNNSDGTCGRKTHEYIVGEYLKRGVGKW